MAATRPMARADEARRALAPPSAALGSTPGLMSLVFEAPIIGAILGGSSSGLLASIYSEVMTILTP